MHMLTVQSVSLVGSCVFVSSNHALGHTHTNTHTYAMSEAVYYATSTDTSGARLYQHQPALDAHSAKRDSCFIHCARGQICVILTNQSTCMISVGYTTVRLSIGWRRAVSCTWIVGTRVREITLHSNVGTSPQLHTHAMIYEVRIVALISAIWSIQHRSTNIGAPNQSTESLQSGESS